MTVSGCTCTPRSPQLCPVCADLLARTTQGQHNSRQQRMGGKRQKLRARLIPGNATDIQTITLELPYPPSANHLYPQGGGHRVLSAEGRAYRKAVAAYAALHPQRHQYPLPGRLSFTMIVICPDHRRRDLTNLPKIVEDSLVAAGVMGDDSQIDEVHLLRKIIKGEQRITVTLQPYREGA